MISIGAVLRSEPVRTVMMFGYDDKPVYARLPDGTLHQIDSVEEGEISVAEGTHDIIVLQVSELTSTEV